MKFKFFGALAEVRLTEQKEPPPGVRLDDWGYVRGRTLKLDKLGQTLNLTPALALTLANDGVLILPEEDFDAIFSAEYVEKYPMRHHQQTDESFPAKLTQALQKFEEFKAKPAAASSPAK